MFIYEGFKKRHFSQKKEWENYSSAELKILKDKLPSGIFEFLVEEGLASYSDNFLWTAYPSEFHTILSSWGLNGEKCFTFMRSAFGSCIYYKKNEFFYLDPIEGRIVSLGDDPYLLLNISLVLDSILANGFYLDYYQTLKADHSILQPDEVFAFSPALQSGGSFATSKVEVLKMKEHLIFLAGLFDHKAKRI